jgi:cellulose synthase/poly-beta-1,6-N-acetylglucosamine synthase-like glycosyltransferase
MLAETVAWLLASAAASMLGWFVAELAAGLIRGKTEASERRADLAVIVPAHDEAAGIAATLSELTALVPASCILVVADNCSDDTAAIARAAGVRVVERREPGRRGKGFALAHAREVLTSDPPGAVMVLDADCRLERGDPRLLAGRAVSSGAAIQSENLQLAGRGDSPIVQIGAFAFFVMNVLRSRGLQRLGGGTILQGTGMVFGWALFARLPLATGNAVEDLDMTLQLARMGVPVWLDDRCRVTSASPGRSAHLEQRRRWEQGFIRMMVHGLPLLASGLARGSRLRSAIAAHMLVPPLALLMVLTAVLLALGIAAAAAGLTTWGPATLLAGALAFASSAVVAAWFVAGREILALRTLLLAPLYVAAKVPLYLGLVSRSPVKWTRTAREVQDD